MIEGIHPNTPPPLHYRESKTQISDGQVAHKLSDLPVCYTLTVLQITRICSYSNPHVVRCQSLDVDVNAALTPSSADDATPPWPFEFLRLCSRSMASYVTANPVSLCTQGAALDSSPVLAPRTPTVRSRKASLQMYKINRNRG